MGKMIFTKDNLKLGLALGLGGPLVGLIFLYYYLYPSFTLLEFQLGLLWPCKELYLLDYL